MGSDPQIAALLLFGPNVEIFNPAAKLLTLPWGLQIARLYMGSKYHVMNNITEKKKKILDNTISFRAYGSSSKITRCGHAV